MKGKGQKGAPGLNAMKARTAEHEARRGVKKEETELDERLGGKGYKPYTSLTGKKVSGDWEDSDRGGGHKAVKRAGGTVKKKSPTYLAYVHNKSNTSKKEDSLPTTFEAKVDQGRSDYGKATIRNWRHSGPKTVEPAMFDPENKRGKTIEKRRAEHKARRGVKGAKVPTYRKEDLTIKNIDGSKTEIIDLVPAPKMRSALDLVTTEALSLFERTRYAKKTGKSAKTGKASKKGGRGAVKDKALAAVLADITKKHGKGAIAGQGGSKQTKKVKGAKSTAGTGKYTKAASSKKALASKAKKAGFKSTQGYVDTMARYGGESNYKKGRGLGT